MNAAFTRGLFMRMVHASLIPQGSYGSLRQVSVTLSRMHFTQ
jgi:hypothetical protein